MLSVKAVWFNLVIGDVDVRIRKERLTVSWGFRFLRMQDASEVIMGAGGGSLCDLRGRRIGAILGDQIFVIKYSLM